MQSITISELKAHLSSEIKKLKDNGGIEIVQRDVPVARLIPIANNSSKIHYHSRAKRKFSFLKPVVEVNFDPIDILLEERGKR